MNKLKNRLPFLILISLLQLKQILFTSLQQWWWALPKLSLLDIMLILSVGTTQNNHICLNNKNHYQQSICFFLQ